jgi:ribose transport system substrate-binding protein
MKEEHNMRKFLTLVLVLMLASLFVPSAMAASKEIAFLPPAMTSPFYASCIVGARPVAEAAGYSLVVMAPEVESDYAGQVQLLEDLITRGVAGIAVCGINQDALVSGIRKANDAGIPVVIFNSITPIEGADIFAYSGYNQYNGGGKIADWVNGKTGGKANVAIIEGLPSTHTTQRKDGFVDRAKASYPGVVLAASQPGDWEREKGMNAAANMLQANPQISVFYGLSDEMALGAAQACRQAGRADIICVGLDGNPNAKEAVKAGQLTATLDVGPVLIGKNAIEALLKAFAGEKLNGAIIEAETTVVDSSNVDEYL